METGTLSIVLLILFVLVAWRVVFSFNRDLVRAKAWKELVRRALPFAALTIMILTLPLVQGREESWVPMTWAIVLGVILVAANFLSMPAGERQASRAFRKGDYEQAAIRYQDLSERIPLARHYTFLGAALGASGDRDEAVEALTKAVEMDPQYGLAYYNRALVQGRMGRKTRSKRDLTQALESDLPRRFKSSARKLLEDM